MESALLAHRTLVFSHELLVLSYQPTIVVWNVETFISHAPNSHIVDHLFISVVIDLLWTWLKMLCLVAFLLRAIDLLEV